MTSDGATLILESTAVDQLAEQGWTLIRDFLAEEEIAELAAEAQRLWETGAFKRAGIGRAERFQIRPDIRSDHILWLDENAPTRAQKVYWQRIETLRREINRAFFAGLVSFEAHFAVYPPGAFYRKHLDQFSSSSDRIISCVLYLNRDWREEYGGALRLYTDGNFIDIQPRAGTCVIFRSDSIYHEVLPSQRERFSVTGWFKRRPLVMPLEDPLRDRSPSPPFG